MLSQRVEAVADGCLGDQLGERAECERDGGCDGGQTAEQGKQSHAERGEGECDGDGIEASVKTRLPRRQGIARCEGARGALAIGELAHAAHTPSGGEADERG